MAYDKDSLLKSSPVGSTHNGRPSGFSIDNDAARSGDRSGRDMARAGAPKKLGQTHIHDGMRSATKTGGDALSGHMASAVDALSGRTVVPSSDGDSGQHPLAAPPVAKGYDAPKPTWGMRGAAPTMDPSHETGKSHNADLGRRVLEDAYNSAAPDDRAARPYSGPAEAEELRNIKR